MTVADTLEPEPSAEPPASWGRHVSGWATPARLVDAALAATIAALTFIVHDVGYALRVPFWVDEAWVAVSTRVNLRALPHVVAVSPLGWTLLLRTMVFGGPQRLRMLPLIFGALAVVAAYGFVRAVPWPSVWWSRVAASLAAGAVLLTPSSLLHDDLKQYTADGFAMLASLFLLARLEAKWSKKALASVAVGQVVLFLVSLTALFVAVAAFAAILTGCMLRRQWRRAGAATVAGLASGAGLGVLFLVLYGPQIRPNLTSYWTHFYLPVSKGIGPSLNYLHLRSGEMARYLGMGPLLLAVALVVGGMVTLILSGRPTLGCFPPLMVIEMMVLSAAKKYPLFDSRTSHFLTVMFAAYAVIGLVGLAGLLARRSVVAALLALTVLSALFVVNVQGGLRSHDIPPEDVRTATRYVFTHRHPGDVVLVSASASEGFSYYWPVGRPVWHRDPAVATNFQTTFPDQPGIIVAADRSPGGIQDATVAAVRQARRHSGARIWLVRMHVTLPEQASWQRVIAAGGLSVAGVIECSLVILQPQPPGQQTEPTQLHGRALAPGC